MLSVPDRRNAAKLVLLAHEQNEANAAAAVVRRCIDALRECRLLNALSQPTTGVLINRRARPRNLSRVHSSATGYEAEASAQVSSSRACSPVALAAAGGSCGSGTRRAQRGGAKGAAGPGSPQ